MEKDNANDIIGPAPIACGGLLRVPAETNLTGVGVEGRCHMHRQEQLSIGNLYPAVIDGEVGVRTRDNFPDGLAYQRTVSAAVVSVAMSDRPVKWRKPFVDQLQLCTLR